MTNKQTVEEIYAAFGRGDIAFIVDKMSPDVKFRQPASVPWGGDYTGPAEVQQFFTKLNDLVETTAFDIEENIEAGDQVISFGYYGSRNRATNKSSRARFVFRWQFQDGKVSRYESVLDSAQVAMAAAA